MSLLDWASPILPDTAKVNAEGHLVIGGCDVVALAAEFGTPLYVFDEATLHGRCAEFRSELGDRYPDTLVIYAAKAFINRALAGILRDEGLGLDVVSGGELSIARSVDFPLEKVYFHGNNKSAEEVELALGWGVGRIVVDNLHELGLLQELAERAGVVQPILLRICPGVDVHTHRHIATAALDSKFGLPIATGQAEEALRQAMAASHIEPLGFHFHLGSLIFDLDPYRQAIETVFQFAAEMRDDHRFVPTEFSPGGGFAIQYTRDAPAPTTAHFAQALTSTTLAMCEELGFEPPRLVVEPGRAIVGRAGVALYRAGATKEIPGVRKYVSVDGGLADNPRPLIYGSRYEAILASRAGEEVGERVTIAGKFCESGDVLVWDAELPPVSPGDILALPVSGAYCLAMASNYNASLKPAIVLVKDGQPRLIRRRESYQDLIKCDEV